MDYTRREIGKLALSVLPTAALVGKTTPVIGAALENQGTAAGAGRVATDWSKQVGLDFNTTTRDVQPDFEGTLMKLAAMGYREIEPWGGYNNMEPKAYKAMLDRCGITMVSTHSPAYGTGADLEKQLEGYQIMGIKYTEISAVRGQASGPAAGGAAAGGRGPVAGAAAAGARGPAGAPTGAGGPGGRGGRGPAPPLTEEAMKRRAQQINDNGKITKKFGIKMLLHNHTGEFELLEGGKLTQYDVLLRETDPDLVAMQMDIGWASVAGQNIIELFKKAPGRFELWHVKDANNIKMMNMMSPALTPTERGNLASLVPVGLGDVDYKTIFANAELAGLKHFCLEQDNSAAWGDTFAAWQVSIRNLTTRILS